MAFGDTVLDFGATPTQLAEVVVTAQAAILATAAVEAFLMAAASADHNAVEHRIVPMTLRCGDIVPGVGFTIFARSEWALTGEFKVRWVWAAV